MWPHWNLRTHRAEWLFASTPRTVSTTKPWTSYGKLRLVPVVTWISSDLDDVARHRWRARSRKLTVRARSASLVPICYPSVFGSASPGITRLTGMSPSSPSYTVASATSAGSNHSLKTDAASPAYRKRPGIFKNPFVGIARDRPFERTTTVTVPELQRWLADASYHVRLATAEHTSRGTGARTPPGLPAALTDDQQRIYVVYGFD